MSKHAKSSSDDEFPVTVDDDTWTRVTATEQWEITPAALSAENARLN